MLAGERERQENREKNSRGVLEWFTDFFKELSDIGNIESREIQLLELKRVEEILKKMNFKTAEKGLGLLDDYKKIVDKLWQKSKGNTFSIGGKSIRVPTKETLLKFEKRILFPLHSGRFRGTEGYDEVDRRVRNMLVENK